MERGMLRTMTKPLPAALTPARLQAQAADHGLSDLDHSALFVELASRNGMN